MNKTKLKSYAPQARKDFIAAVTVRANQLGLSSNGGTLDVAPSQPQGDFTVIAGQAWPIKVDGQRQRLITRIQKDGFDHTMEAVAYTWFNRFAALRYMELHDYLGHGHRALSSTAGGLPDILTYAAELAQGGNLSGLRAPLVLEMKLAGNRDGELYRLLLVAQCNALSNAMPFLFERIDDDSELLLPDNLLRSDSVIAKLVEGIPEEDWSEVEIIGWLYQFYISEKKDQVIGKVVKSEDIPAATQLFTPNWIVQYLVQNSLGRLWLMANPQSTLAQEWPYYITPAEQMPEVQAQLDALIQTRVREDGDTLNPESITVLDPACGSGHILVVAYDVLKAIYLERGYQPRAIPRLILEKNLFGLDIDDRAAQMAGFALLMKARADDRRLFTVTDDAGNLQPPKLNVLALQSSQGLNAAALAQALSQSSVGRVSPQGVTRQAANDFARDDLFPATYPQMTLAESVSAQTSGYAALTRPTRLPDAAPVGRVSPQGVTRQAIAELIATFAHAKTFGSLIQISQQRLQDVRELLLIVQQAEQTGDLYAQAAAQDLLPLLQQAQVLAMEFDAVVANPPYMGGKGMNPALKDYAKATFPNSKSDLFAMFMERGFEWCKSSGFNSMVTMQSWMFLSSYEDFRSEILDKREICQLTQIGYNSFPEINSKVAQACAFVMGATSVDGYLGKFLNLNGASQAADKKQLFHARTDFMTRVRTRDQFKLVPGRSIAIWASDNVLESFSQKPRLADYIETREGLATGSNERFLRYWYEVSAANVCFPNEGGVENDTVTRDRRWFPYIKGGAYRRWGGNQEYVVDWYNDGVEMRNFSDPETGRVRSHNYNGVYGFRPGITWSSITSGDFSVRAVPAGFMFDAKGPMGFPKLSLDRYAVASFLNSKVASHFIGMLAPTLDYKIGHVLNLPFLIEVAEKQSDIGKQCVAKADQDWSELETFWMYLRLSFIPETPNNVSIRIQKSWSDWNALSLSRIADMRLLEEENNRIFINAYGLQSELSPEVPESQITLARADREKDCQRLISYAIGCMMGRYSLDEPGLIYAHAGNVGFEPGRYATFPADADGIVPLTDEFWFADDACSRIREFLRAVWEPDTLEENMAWLAESLGTKATETPDETIRRYVADKFFKDHLQTYKKRPIYWLFSSGKQGAFQALVYLHRYHEGTLARLRAEYVVPLTGKIQSRIEMLQKDATAASSTAARNKLAKEVEKLKKKQVELLAYDEQLRHYADMRITLDLDDGVKVNYGKFGDLLAEVKAVTGGAGDE